MDFSEYLAKPEIAAIFAGVVTTFYLMGKSKLNKEATPETSDLLKPSILIAILVFFIVYMANSDKDVISTAPFN